LFHFATALVLLSASAVLTFAGEEKIVVTSPAFQSGAKIPEQFTCKGGNISPSLSLSGVPPGVKSLALIVDDPDAPSGLFTHWLVWNVPSPTREVAEKNVPSGALQGTNDFGKSGYGGPCPPSGTHRYYFRVIALDRILDLRPGANRQDFDKATAGHVVARGELMGGCSHYPATAQSSAATDDLENQRPRGNRKFDSW